MKGKLTDTKEFAKKFINSLEYDKNGATLVCLHGNLGAGKTTFTQYIAEHYNIQEPITSPTYVLQKIYDIDDDHFDSLIHIDAYRMEKGSELDTIDFKEIMKDPKNIIFLEWPEKVEDALPQTAYHIYFSFVDEDTREIQIKP